MKSTTTKVQGENSELTFDEFKHHLQLQQEIRRLMKQMPVAQQENLKLEGFNPSPEYNLLEKLMLKDIDMIEHLNKLSNLSPSEKFKKLSESLQQKINAVESGSTDKIELTDGSNELAGDFVIEAICGLIEASKLKEVKIFDFVDQLNIKKLVDSIKSLDSDQNQVNVQISYQKVPNDKIEVDSLLKDLPNVECKIKELNEKIEWVARVINKKNPASAAASVDPEVLPAVTSSEDDSDYEHLSQEDLVPTSLSSADTTLTQTPSLGVDATPPELLN